MTRMILFATLALGLAACGKGEGETKTEPATTEPTAPVATDKPAADPAAGGTDPAAADAGTGAEPAAAGSGGDAPPEAATAEPVPTTEDFEEKAAKEVDQKNLETEVSKMEKELGIETPKK
jgi:hypothetical protein